MKNVNTYHEARSVDGNKITTIMPNLAATELLNRLNTQGIETVFDRHDSQQPQCKFGLNDSCCRMCHWGPCRITPATPRGICGRNQRAVAAANTLRSLAAGLACQLIHGREVLLTTAAATDGACDIKLKGEEKTVHLARRLNIRQGRQEIASAGEVALVLLDSLGRLTSQPLPLLKAYAPAERSEAWERLGITPRSAAFEVTESLHMTTLGGCSDDEAIIKQVLRSSLSYIYSALFASSAATEMLYGIPEPVTTEVNFGVLKKDHVNILIHGHSPVMVEKVLQKIHSPEIQRMAKTGGAKGIIVGGLCCTGSSLLASYGVPTVTNIIGQELVLGTGAIDTVVVDMQCIIPGMKIAADCFGTEIITTCSSNRIPGATHIPFDPEKPETLDRDAMFVAKKAVEAFAKRDRSKAEIPNILSRATAGWSYEAIVAAFGGIEQLLDLMKAGSIKGIATIVGCSSPKVPYDSNAVTIARKLLEQGILVTTTGCTAHALLNAGLCSQEASRDADPGLRVVCEKLDIPPVLAVGGCVDNVRTLRVFIDLADAAGVAIKDMPYMLTCPEPGNEKAIGLGIGFMCHGISGIVGLSTSGTAACPVELYREYGLKEKLGASLYADTDPHTTSAAIVRHIGDQRRILGWS